MPEEVIQWETLTAEEKNKLVAEKVMGWKPEPCTDGQLGPYMGSYWGCTCGWVSSFYLGTDESTEHNKPILCYTESMDAAWFVLQKIAARRDEKACFQLLDSVYWAFCDNLLRDELESSYTEIYPAHLMIAYAAKWTPETICIAALKAYGCTLAEEQK